MALRVRRAYRSVTVALRGERIMPKAILAAVALVAVTVDRWAMVHGHWVLFAMLLPVCVLSAVLLLAARPRR
jgi:hypothetical protein